MSDQETIAILNQRTADNDVEMLRLNRLLAEMQGHVDARTEAESNLVKATSTIEELNTANAKLLSDGQAVTQQLQSLAEQMQSLQTENSKLSSLYAAQNNYVLALESQAPEPVAKAMNDLKRTQIELQIVQLQGMLD
jgi:chromosome segregation ATPase